MNLYLSHRDPSRSETRNSNGIHSALCVAADEAAALEVCEQNAPTGETRIDGWLVEDAVFVEGTGIYRWAPSPQNPTITEWSPGEHTVRVAWDKVSGFPDPGEYEWSFRVG